MTDLFLLHIISTSILDVFQYFTYSTTVFFPSYFLQIFLDNNKLEILTFLTVTYLHRCLVSVLPAVDNCQLAVCRKNSVVSLQETKRNTAVNGTNSHTSFSYNKTTHLKYMCPFTCTLHFKIL